MNTSDDQTADDPRAQRMSAADRSTSTLLTAASRPGVDPCDVAVEAMPAHVLGDLAPPDAGWLLEHTAECNWCSNQLDRFGRLDRALDELDQIQIQAQIATQDAVPPRFVIPRRPAARRAAYAQVESPVGPLFVAATDAGVCEIGFARSESEAEFRRRLEARGFDPTPASEAQVGAGSDGREPALDRATRELREYFGGGRHRFDLPLDWTGVSPFARAVLEATTQVPFGHLGTYRDIARRIGRPGATRAVGNALGRNPIPVVVPCHRIVRSDASLGGYTGGSFIKERLLALEGATLGS